MDDYFGKGHASNPGGRSTRIVTHAASKGLQICTAIRCALHWVQTVLPPRYSWVLVLLCCVPPATPADSGSSIARRLNRTEYSYSVRDLLGLRDDPAIDFPPDDSSYGFDNIAGVLSISPVLMEHYLKAAEKA